jgi:hypothetical protein
MKASPSKIIEHQDICLLGLFKGTQEKKQETP